MDRLEAMRIFAMVAESGGFASAARRLGQSPPAVTRAVAALEARIGVRLLTRTTRIVRLTEAGTRYLADCRRILAEIEEADAAAAGTPGALRGPLAVTASAMFGRVYVAPILLEFAARHPEVVARLVLIDRVADLIEEGLDIAVRIAPLPDSTMQARRVGQVRRVVCAAPDYLGRHGTPQVPADLEGHAALVFSQSGGAEDWRFESGGRGMVIRPRTVLSTNVAEVAVAAAVAGRGITRVLSYQAAAELRDGRLVPVLEPFEPAPIPIHIVHHEGRRAGARVRAFVDLAVERLRDNPLLR